jgi:Protein of unknown function (DUF732)
MTRTTSLAALLVAAAAMSGAVPAIVPAAHAKPAPEVEYMYDVAVRRQYNFPNGDAIGYGYGICDRVGRGSSYAQLVDQVRSDVTPKDGAAVNYLISYSVEILCPAQIGQLRNSAVGYVPPEGWFF